MSLHYTAETRNRLAGIKTRYSYAFHFREEKERINFFTIERSGQLKVEGSMSWNYESPLLRHTCNFTGRWLLLLPRWKFNYQRLHFDDKKAYINARALSDGKFIIRNKAVFMLSFFTPVFLNYLRANNFHEEGHNVLILISGVRFLTFMRLFLKG